MIGRHSVIWGRRRQGKSTLALALAAASGKRPIIIWDPCAQYTQFPRVQDPLELEEILELESVEAFRYQPDSVQIADEFVFFMEVLDGGRWAWSDYALVLDETSLLQKPQSLHPSLARLIRQGPDDIKVVQTLHRPSETHSTVRALATDVFFFQTYLERDLTVIEQTWGAEVRAEVARLPQHHVLHFWLAPGGAPCYTIWSQPEDWYIRIGGYRPNERA